MEIANFWQKAALWRKIKENNENKVETVFWDTLYKVTLHRAVQWLCCAAALVMCKN